MVAAGIIIVAAVVAVVVAGGVLFSTGTIGYNILSPTQNGNQESTESDSDATEITTTETVTVETNQAGENIIEMSSAGFSPSSLTIKEGETVKFTTVDSGSYWPASAFHPTHTVYPGSSIEKCGQDENIFDACAGIGEGESWSFTFNEAGEWAYHDHLNSRNFGKIIVQP